MYRPTVPRYSNDQVANAANLNAPIDALVERTDWLKNNYGLITDKSSLVLFGVTVDSSVALGNAVYFDLENSCFKPAKAAWSTEYDNNGELLPAESSKFIGVVIYKSNATTANVFAGGQITDKTFIQNVLGTSPVAGDYYLSADTAGNITTNYPPQKVPVLKYTGNSIILSNQSVAQPNHVHRSYSLEEGWYSISDSRFDDMNKPSGAVYGYNIASDSDLLELFATFPGKLVFFKDGELQPTSYYEVTEENVWWKQAQDLTGSDVQVFSYAPFLHGEPILRAAKTDSEELQISAKNGILTVNISEWGTQEGGGSATAISSIEGRQATTTPIVPDVIAGPGISISKSSAGVATIARSEYIAAQLDAELINLNNALEITDSPYIYYAFPANRISSVIARCSVPKFGDTGTYEAAVFAWRAGIVGATTGTPLVFPEVTVEVSRVINPKGLSYSEIPASATLTTSLSAITTVQNRLYFSESSDRLDVTSEDSLYVKFSLGSSANDKQMMRFGIIVYAK